MILSYKKFLAAFAGLSASCLLLAGGLNFWLDPYSLWGGERKAGFNMRAFKAESVERMGKLIGLLEAEEQPEAVFIGSSQVHWGIDATACGEVLGRPVYNLGVRGMSAYEQRRYAEHVLSVDPAVKTIYLAADFTKYIDGPHYRAPGGESMADEEAQVGCGIVVPHNLARTLFSWDALRDSYETWRENKRHRWETPYYAPGGSVSPDAMWDFFAREHWRFERSMMQVEREGWAEEPRLREDCLEELRRIARLCEERGVQLIIYIPPMHAYGMEAYQGCLEQYGQWLQAVSRIAPTWDFLRYNEITASPVEPGWLSSGTNEYFWDSVHHKQELGTALVRLMEGRADAGLPENFGSLVTPEKVPELLREMRSGHAAWLAVHPESAELARYYAGFSELEPLALQGRAVQDSEGSAVLLAGTKDELWRPQLSRQDKLEARGWHLLPEQEVQAAYAVLSRADGLRLYAMAEPVPSPELSDIMHSHIYEMSGFRIQEPLWQVEPGEYELSLVSVLSDGSACRTGVLAAVTVLP